jgi:hypothetical protein
MSDVQMEVPMPHTAIPRTITAFVFLIATFAAPAQGRSPFMGMKGAAITSAAISGSQPDAPKGLATQPPAQRKTTTHYEIRWWQDYTNGGR